MPQIAGPVYTSGQANVLRDNDCEDLPGIKVELDLILLGRFDGLDHDAVCAARDRLSALPGDRSDRDNPVIDRAFTASRNARASVSPFAGSVTAFAIRN